tara:strand:- start:111 stop:290 length:180 start_codon:yes stop_codon:yes gene_type:complete
MKNQFLFLLTFVLGAFSTALLISCDDKEADTSEEAEVVEAEASDEPANEESEESEESEE